jgi:hypothetical protein
MLGGEHRASRRTSVDPVNIVRVPLAVLSRGDVETDPAFKNTSVDVAATKFASGTEHVRTTVITLDESEASGVTNPDCSESDPAHSGLRAIVVVFIISSWPSSSSGTTPRPPHVGH